MNSLYIIIGIVVVLLLTIIGLLARIKKCPSDMIMVIYGKVGGNKSAKCVHGGASFIWPFIQNYSYMSLRPLQFNCNLQNALSSQNIRVDVPTTVTVGISTEPEIMQSAAERLVGLDSDMIEDLVKDIVYGQLRLIISNMTIEELNAERDKFLDEVRKVVATELKKIGLQLINVNIIDINDEAGYIKALGQKDKAIAINQANVEIATAEKDGAIKQAEQQKIKNSSVAETIKDEEISVAESNKIKDVAVAQKNAESETGKIEAQKKIVAKQAELKVSEVEAARQAETAKVEAAAKVAERKQLAQIEVVKAQAKVQQEEELALREAELAKAEKAKAQLYADEIVPAEIAKEKAAKEAEAYQIKLEKTAEADKNAKVKIAEGLSQAESTEAAGKSAAISSIGKAEAEAIRAKGLAEAEAEAAKLAAQADGFKKMIEAAEANPQIAIAFKMVQEGTYENIAKTQVEAYKHMNFGNIQIMDTSKGAGITDFMGNLISQISPMLNVMKGMDIPKISDKLNK